MSAHTTVAPAPANAKALARPMPLPAPVMMATLPSTRNELMSVVASMEREGLSDGGWVMVDGIVAPNVMLS
jgi:hypothetical protein